MEKNEHDGKSTPSGSIGSSKESTSAKIKVKSRGKKRKRRASGSSSEYEDVLPENTFDMEKSLHASAIKNNLDETSVRKIIKKVVTNDRVLALVKLREEAEGANPEEDSMRPKLTRAKVKELMRVSPKTTAWNLENLELTPIKHIPVKTRPEVKALIAQELPEDEDDEEYEPTHDDVPSDDDQGLESCSDLDSQPRTPATPRSQHSISPKVVTDGPFKVPQDISTPTRRKLDLEEDATIALRTRSKLSLSATSIEHIESTFVPPDDLPMPAVDDLWNQFLNECLNPASTSKNEDDDETDPEYNVAADPDAHDEDEEALGNTIIKISKKELSDLVTELFNIMPEPTPEDQLMADNLADSAPTDQTRPEISMDVSGPWEGKQEPLSDEENGTRKKLSDRITFEKKNYSKVSLGKIEPHDPEEETVKETPPCEKKDVNKENSKQPEEPREVLPVVNTAVEEQVSADSAHGVPPLLRNLAKPAVLTECVLIQVDQGVKVLPEQIQILQQQLRQHIQLATSNFMQLYAHPMHWTLAPHFKEYLETFNKLGDANPKSVVNVCNLKPAVELVNNWEKALCVDSPENTAILEFILKEAERSKRRAHNKNLYVGDFHEIFKKVVANSPVFLYPYLLPSMPYRGEKQRRFCYLHSEDELIALGLEQFWQYVVNNPSIYKPRPVSNPGQRWGLTVTVNLVAKYMFPWIPVKVLHGHIQHARKNKDKENPIYRYFQTLKVNPVKHKLLPYNPRMTLYEQPEHEVPRLWVRYLAKTSKRFKSYLLRRTNTTGFAPTGVDVELGHVLPEPPKAPLPIAYRAQPAPPAPPAAPAPPRDTFDIQITSLPQSQAPVVSNLYKFVETSTGAYLLPLTSVTMSVNSNTGPITSATEVNSNIIANNLPETTQTEHREKIKPTSEHCTCCILLRRICKQRQSVITDYFGGKKANICGCKEKRYPKVSNRLRLLVNNYKSNYTCALQELRVKLALLTKGVKDDIRLNKTNNTDLDDFVYVTKFHMKLLARTAVARHGGVRRKVSALLARFRPQQDEPLALAAQLDHALGNDLVDLYKEFYGFLTPDQADRLDVFKDYFVRNCVTDLVSKVEEEVNDVARRRSILEELNRVFSKNLSSACEICTDILSTLEGYPALAQYVHDLFPHRKENRPVPKEVASVQQAPQPTQTPLEDINDSTLCESTVLEDTNMDYEADQSMSEEDDNNCNSRSKSTSESESNDGGNRAIKTENTSSDYTTPTLVITVSKTEVQDFSESSNASMKIMFEDEIVKSETPEWKRDEDKLILEVLKEHLTEEERKDKTILEIIDEKNIIDMITQSLIHKSKHDVKTRLLYLLELC